MIKASDLQIGSLYKFRYSGDFGIYIGKEVLDGSHIIVLSCFIFPKNREERCFSNYEIEYLNPEFIS